jgi:Mannosyltransferase putative
VKVSRDERTNIAEVSRYRDMLERLLQSLPAFPENRYQGRGIVICGGGNYYFPCVWVCIRMLRSVGCTLPIELWHRGPREMTDEMKAFVEPCGVVCKDSFTVACEFPVHRLDGWELKPYAILHSRFAEVLYIDADNVVVRDPEYLFDTALYRQTGSLFWPDLPIPASGQWYLKGDAWELLDLPFRQEPEFEAGQLVIDKRRCWRAMHLTLHLNEHSDYYYAVFFGDKDTFHLAWRKVAQEYSIIPHPPKALGDYLVLVQFDPEGKRLFQHRCNAKWTMAQRNVRVPGFLFEEECLGFLHELGTRCPGSFEEFSMSFTPAEQLAFEEIVLNRTFRHHRNGQEVGVCIFLPDLTATLSGESFGWHIEEDKEGEAVLIFTEAGRPLCFLRKTRQASWAGRWRFGERSAIELWPQDGIPD